MIRDLSVSTLHPRHTRSRWTPPFRRLPAWEMMLWKSVIVVGIFAVPTYICLHLADYRKGRGTNMYMLRQGRVEPEDED